MYFLQNERARDTETPVGATSGESDDISPTQKAKIQKMQQKMAKVIIFLYHFQVHIYIHVHVHVDEIFLFVTTSEKKR
jgi:hypothetical protein